MSRAYISISSHDVAVTTDNDLYGRLASALPFAVEPAQRAAWNFQISHLRGLARDLPDAHCFLEFLIPRMGRRADLVILHAGIVFVVEYKIGASGFDRASLDQAYGYGLDLKHFHETSHALTVVPILIATDAPRSPSDETVEWDDDGLAKPIRNAPDELARTVQRISHAHGGANIDAQQWSAGRYRPTPTIVEAAQALYSGHDVEEISRSEAGARNLSDTANYVFEVIDQAKAHAQKSICFITGVPGSGKTLAGLNLATARQRAHSEEHAVFLSGNGPLVEVLREALACDAVAQAKRRGKKVSKAAEAQLTSAFIQNIHHFRDEALRDSQAPVERVAIFDEAQRAWDVAQASKFMKQKKGVADFNMSEPEFLLSVMDRHHDWSVIVCLVGGGQEINTGEAGIGEWLRALERSFPNWHVHLPDQLKDAAAVSLRHEVNSPALHLATSIRSFRAERLSDFVGALIDGGREDAAKLSAELKGFPLFLTRDLEGAREWLRSKRRGNERAGLLASSNALRLKPDGIFVKAKVEPAKWFLAPGSDVRSSDALEDAATEFEVQGLELDWSCVCWDANLIRRGDAWLTRQFKGTVWQTVNDDNRQRYIANAYRVLLTRARQGMVIYVPRGDLRDKTREPRDYDRVFAYLAACGIPEL